MKRKINLLTQFRHQLMPIKSRTYLSDFRNSHPNLDPHHIMGSTHGFKFTDLLLVGVDRQHHNLFQKNLPKYFPLLLLPAVQELTIWCVERSIITRAEATYYQEHHENVHKMNELFAIIKKASVADMRLKYDISEA